MIDPDATPSAPVTRRPLWRDVPILIAVSAGLVHFVRGAVVDGAVFVSTGVALVVAELRDRRTPRSPSRPARGLLGARRITLGVLVCLVFGVVVGQWAPASVPVVLAMIVPGLLIAPLAWRVGPAGRAPRPGAGRWAWAVVMVLVCLWELNSFLRQPDPRTDSYDHPTLSAILNPLFESPAVRSVVLVGWLAVGLWLARRLTTAPDREVTS